MVCYYNERPTNGNLNQYIRMEKELLHKYFRGETSPEEEKLIMDWAEASPENYHEYLEERKIWSALLIHYYNVDNKVAVAKRFSLYHLYKYAAAVAVILILAGSYMVYTYHSPELLTLQEISEPTLLINNKEHIALTEKSFTIEKKRTKINNDHENNKLSYQRQEKQSAKEEITTNRLLIPHGKTYQLTLPDGTIVTLNAESELTFPSQFDSQTRTVSLKGEAFFQVAKNKDKPFIVHTEQMDVRVLGTTFNVSNYAEDNMLRTTLIEGSVCIEQNGNTQLIRPSEQYIYNKETNETAVQVVDTDLYTSWTNNEYIFRNTTLEDILTQIGHWYKFHTDYETPSLKEKRFSFTIGRDASLDQIIRFINNTEEIYIERNNENIHIKNNP